ncbi:MAG: ribonucleoside-diphosphate reductase [Candidatus Levybacteria bacterium RBG_16_35_11]|nr:MAG: ribonucleoside-diphosphate reductase [Candidatus Levybacteria bacterium RBG_16_35_11]
MKLDGIREKVFLDRYSLKDKKGNPTEKTPEQMWRRVAKGVAKVEKKENRKNWEKKFFDSMQDFKFVPGGRILAGAGTGFDVTFYNCFVLPSPADSRDGILDNLKAMIEIMARGGGAGINLSSLRPRGARVKKVNGFSSGPCNWAELYSIATHDIIQQGGSRRGALMLMLWDWHPDIEEFITIKQDLQKITGANLSVCVSDKFMEAVKKNGDWNLVFPDKDDKDYDEKWDGDLEKWKSLKKKVKVYKTVKARKIWNLICEAAWKSAEPGIVFMERYNKWYNNWYWNKVICTNPCGEEGLSAWGVCNLASLNLSAFVKNYSVDIAGEMDYKELAEHAKIGVRLQDNVIDLDSYVFPQIRERQQKGERRIGLGTMGLGDALIKMHIRYGSEESLKVIEKIFATIRDAAYEASTELAKEKGAFPKFIATKYLKGYFIKKLPKEIRAKIRKYGTRNSLLLQEAPTGSTSLLAGVSSGIEPIYEFEFTRRDRLGEHKMYHHLYEEWKKAHPDELKPDYFVSANDLTPQDHVRVQGTIQKYVDASISKTVNAPKAHTVEDVKKLYMLAYEEGCKGIAYMREGSRDGVLTRMDAKKEDVVKEKPKAASLPILPRPYMVEGVTYQTETPVGKTYITINHNENKDPFEVFITVGKSGSDVAAMADALGRMISVTLRLNGDLPPRERIRQIVAHLIGIGGAKSIGFGTNRVRSLPDAVAKVLATHFGFAVNGIVEDRNKAHLNGSQNVIPVVNGQQNGMVLGNGQLKNQIIESKETISTEKSNESDEKQEVVVLEQLSLQTQGGELSSTEGMATGLFDICPECGSGSLAYEEGCRKCYSCGYSEC